MEDEKVLDFCYKNLSILGYRYWSSGDYRSQGSDGYYWSSSPFSDSSNAHYLYFGYTGVNPSNSTNRAYGFSVRLLSDETEQEWRVGDKCVRGFKD